MAGTEETAGSYEARRLAAARVAIPGFVLCACEKCGALAFLELWAAPDQAGWDYDETKPKCGQHTGTYYMHRVGAE